MRRRSGVVAAAAIPCALVAVAIGLIAPSQRPLLGAALAIPFALYAQGGRGLLLAMGATAAVAWQGAITSVAFSAAVIAALLIWHVSSYQALALWVVAQAGAAGYTALVLGRRIARSGPSRNEHSLAFLIREQLHFGSRSSLATVAGYINLRIDVFLISALLGPRMLGIYTLAVSTGEMLWSISLPVIWAALENIAGDTFAEAAKLAAGLMRSVVALQVTLGIVLFIAGPWLIVHVYGAAFAGAGTVLRILLPGLVVYAVETFPRLLHPRPGTAAVAVVRGSRDVGRRVRWSDAVVAPAIRHEWCCRGDNGHLRRRRRIQIAVLPAQDRNRATRAVASDARRRADALSPRETPSAPTALTTERASNERARAIAALGNTSAPRHC